MKIEAGASLRCLAVNIHVAGRGWRIPPLPAADWLEAIAGTWLDIVPGLIDDPDGEFDDLLIDGAVGMAECEAAAKGAVAAVSGMRWWTAIKLANTVNGQWHTVGGEVLRSGVDPGVRSLGAVLTAVYWAFARHMDDQKLAKLHIDLDKPPRGVPVSEMYDRDAAAQAFLALAASGG